MKTICRLSILVLLSLLFNSLVFAQLDPSSLSGRRYKRIVIREATVIDGSGKPAPGPFDTVIENDRIAQGFLPNMDR
ncbi:MAG: hypothetical protein ABI999_15535, partial [Acidobacteriota bacterium]